MKNKRIDLNKNETQSGSFNKKQLIDFIKTSNTCIGKDILVQHEYVEIINDNNNIQKELNSKSICGTIEITQGKQEMKIDKTDLILQEIKNMNDRVNNINDEIKNMKNDFNEFKVEVKYEFKKVNARLDNVEKDFNEFKVEVKEEFKKVNSRLDIVENDIKDIKNCPTIKSELNISK
ncbi:hypothetical protein [Malacoplasma muris]|uniref:hypothetical protein n=1 Tax=Malacoplasma muris TaxID=2119 RepID=UPI00398EDA09